VAQGGFVNEEDDLSANFSHQEKLFDPRESRAVKLCGAGSVGSFVLLLLAMMGVRDIEMWDEDFVSSHNVPMGYFTIDDVGRKKVIVLRERMMRERGFEIMVHPEMYTGQKDFKNCSVISCVDTMAARALIWSKVKDNPSVDLFIDTRTAEAYVEVLAIVPTDERDIGRYEKLLYNDEDAKRQMCGLHGIVYVSNRAANIVAANLTQFWQEHRKEWRVGERCDILQKVF
jgi:hypothetical protein